MRMLESDHESAREVVFQTEHTEPHSDAMSRKCCDFRLLSFICGGYVRKHPGLNAFHPVSLFLPGRPLTAMSAAHSFLRSAFSEATPFVPRLSRSQSRKSARGDRGIPENAGRNSPSSAGRASRAAGRPAPW